MFANLVETDQVYGHRKDVEGFHGALREIDAAVGGWLERLDPARDLLVLTADHGCDPTTPGTDHTREHAPLLARSRATAAAATTGRSPTSAPRAALARRPRRPGAARASRSCREARRPPAPPPPCGGARARGRLARRARADALARGLRRRDQAAARARAGARPRAKAAAREADATALER